MPELRYARGRIIESIQFITEEMVEFEKEYVVKTWQDYQSDKKLQKLMDRTVENILTALIEVSGTILTQEGIPVESYSDALRRIGEIFCLSQEEQENLANLAFQRNRLAHRYLNLRWQAISSYVNQRDLIQRLLNLILEEEEKKRPEQ